MLDEAKDLIKAIKTFDEAADGDSGDAEYEASIEMRNAARTYLIAACVRDVEQIELIERELPD